MSLARVGQGRDLGRASLGHHSGVLVGLLPSLPDAGTEAERAARVEVGEPCALGPAGGIAGNLPFCPNPWVP